MAEKINLYLGEYRQGKTNFILNKALAQLKSDGNQLITYIIVPSLRSANLVREKIFTLNGQDNDFLVTGFKIETFYQFCKSLLNKLNNPKKVCRNDLRQAVLVKALEQSELNFNQNLSKDFLSLIDEFERGFYTPDEIIAKLEISASEDSNFIDMAKIYKLYWHKLNELDFLDERQLVFEGVKFLHETSAFKLGSLIVDGFDRFNKLQLMFFTQLLPFVENFDMTFDYVHNIDESSSSNEYLWKKSSFDLIDKDFKPKFNIIEFHKPLDKPNNLQIYQAFNLRDEVYNLAISLKDLVINKNVDLSQILVLATNIKPYIDPINYIFKQSQIPFYIDDNILLKEIPVFITFLNLVTLNLNNFEVKQFFSLAKSSLFNFPLLNHNNVLELENLCYIFGVNESIQEWQYALKDRASLKNIFENFTNIFCSKNFLATVEVHANYLENLLDKYIIPALKKLKHSAESEIEQNQKIDDYAKTCDYYEFLNKLAIIEIRQSLLNIVADSQIHADNSKITYEQFMNMFIAKIESKRVYNPNTQNNNLLITTLSQAPNRSYEYIFVLGLCEEYFSTGYRGNYYNNYDELNKWSMFNINLNNPRHDINYDYSILKLIIKQARYKIALSYPKYDNADEELSQSLILQTQKLLNQDLADIVDYPIVSQSYQNVQPKIISARQYEFNKFLSDKYNETSLTDRPKNYDLSDETTMEYRFKDFIGDLIDNNYRLSQIGSKPYSIDQIKTYWLNKTYSPSRFNEYAKCPFKFFANYILKLKPRVNIEYKLDFNKLGTFYHKVLELLFTKIISQNIPNSANDKIFSILDECFNEALADLEKNIAWHKNNRWQLKIYEFKYRLKRFVERTFVLENITKAYPYACEYKFGEIEPLSVTLNTKEVLLKGSIDRLDINDEGEYIIVDYKLKQSGITQDDVLNSTQCQIPLYAIALMAQQKNVANGFYLSINGAKTLTRLDGQRNKYSVLQYIENTKANIENFIDNIENGFYPVKPYKASVCNTCDYMSVCGIKSEDSSSLEGFDDSDE